ncbi:MAG: Uma2 family endonuclease [Oribacterium sp.]|nr:Uma2 family endonuclease [Oribacterium sp.]
MSNLEYIIKSFIKNTNCVVMREAKYEWEGVPEKYEPDISLLYGLRRRKRLCYTDVQRFIAEVLSDSTEHDDRNKKMEVYDSVGVEEYWLIDWRVPGGKIERYLYDDTGKHYLMHDMITGDKQQEVSLILFPTIYFTMNELMEHVGEDIL